MPDGMGGREVEPFVGEDEILRHTVPLVVQQAEHGLGERISLHGALRIEIRGGVIGLRFTESVFIEKAKQAERFRVATQRQWREFSCGTNVVATRIGSGAACQRVRMRRWYGCGADQRGEQGGRQSPAADVN